MRGWGTSTKSLFFGSFLLLSYQVVTPAAEAAANRHSKQSTGISHQSVQRALHASGYGKASARGRQYARRGGISCVPFARNDTGIAVSGNAWQWWDNAAGVYARGSVPENGSVLTFRSNGRMRLGHVAVVSRVINPRQIEIEHANWWGPGQRGGVARNIPVVDVSEANDWSAVRVGLGRTGDFGSVYPTYGFIYDRPDTGVMVATKSAPAPQPDLNPAPADLRPIAERGWQTYEEVAEAPVVPKQRKRMVHSASGRHHVASVSTARR